MRNSIDGRSAAIVREFSSAPEAAHAPRSRCEGAGRVNRVLPGRVPLRILLRFTQSSARFAILAALAPDGPGRTRFTLPARACIDAGLDPIRRSGVLSALPSMEVAHA